MVVSIGHSPEEETSIKRMNERCPVWKEPNRRVFEETPTKQVEANSRQTLKEGENKRYPDGLAKRGGRFSRSRTQARQPEKPHLLRAKPLRRKGESSGAPKTSRKMEDIVSPGVT